MSRRQRQGGGRGRGGELGAPPASLCLAPGWHWGGQRVSEQGTRQLVAMGTCHGGCGDTPMSTASSDVPLLWLLLAFSSMAREHQLALTQLLDAFASLTPKTPGDGDVTLRTRGNCARGALPFLPRGTLSGDQDNQQGAAASRGVKTFTKIKILPPKWQDPPWLHNSASKPPISTHQLLKQPGATSSDGDAAAKSRR